MAAASMTVTLGDGSNCRLWLDCWASVGALNLFAPDLFMALSRAGRKRSLREGLHNNQWARDITGAPTIQVLCQYLRVWRILQDVVLDPVLQDRFIWRWSADGKYTTSSAYRAFFAGSESMPGAVQLWKAKVPARVKFFFWLACHGRLWTAERRKRHGLQDDDACALCGQEPETADHLFLGCVVAREVWLRLLEPTGLGSLAPQRQHQIVDWWLRQRLKVDNAARTAFDALLLLICWELWKERNNVTFQRAGVPVSQLVLRIVQVASEWVQAGFGSLSPAQAIWSQHFVSM
jgi:hypothetical protein